MTKSKKVEEYTINIKVVVSDEDEHPWIIFVPEMDINVDTISRLAGVAPKGSVIRPQYGIGETNKQ